MGVINSRNRGGAGGGGGSGTDTVARTTATASATKLDELYPDSGDSVPVNAEVFLKTTDKGVLNFKNRTAAAITLPATLTEANVLAAGLTALVQAAAPAGLRVVPVAASATLVAGEYSSAQPAVNVVQSFTAPAVSKGAWFGIVNTGAGSMDVAGSRLTGVGAAWWVSDSAGTAWTLASLSGSVAIPGQYLGVAATFAALPTGGSQGDWAVLSADDVGTGTAQSPQYVKGGYLYSGTAYSFAFAMGSAATVATLTQAQAEDQASTEAGGVTGQRLMQAVRAHMDRTFRFYGASDTVDFDTVHNGTAGNTDALHLIAWQNGTNLSHSPDGSAATGVDGHGYYIGTATEGQQFVYFVRDTKGNASEFWRNRVAGAWGNWTVVSSDDWVESGNNFRYVSGQHVILKDGHAVNFLRADQRSTRLIPDTDWANVGTITTAQADWAFEGAFPTSGRQEVVLIGATARKRFIVAAMTGAAASAMKGATATEAGTAGLVPAPAAGDEAKALSGAGTYVALPGTMTGATASAAGKGGLAPAPAAGDEEKYLSGAGTYIALSTVRTITGTGVAAGTSGRDKVALTVAITGLTAGSYIAPGGISASGGATISLVDGGKGGTAQVTVIPNGANTALTYTQTVWKRTVSAVASSGGAVNVDGVATKDIDATQSQTIALTVPGGNYVSGVTATGATVTGFTASGLVTFLPTNSANVALTATFVAGSAVFVTGIANAGIDVTLGNYRIRMNGASNRSMMISTVTGTATLNGETSYYGGTGHSYSAISNRAVTTTPALVVSSWGFGNAGDSQRFEFNDGGGIYDFVMRIGSGYNGNSFVLKRLS